MAFELCYLVRCINTGKGKYVWLGRHQRKQEVKLSKTIRAFAFWEAGVSKIKKWGGGFWFIDLPRLPSPKQGGGKHPK